MLAVDPPPELADDPVDELPPDWLDEYVLTVRVLTLVSGAVVCCPVRESAACAPKLDMAITAAVASKDFEKVLIVLSVRLSGLGVMHGHWGVLCAGPVAASFSRPKRC